MGDEPNAYLAAARALIMTTMHGLLAISLY
jgi:hypothetical protein